MTNLTTQDFDYHLPKELIAKFPLKERSASRLLHLNKLGVINHQQFTDILDLVQPNDLLVFNDSRVIPARLFGNKTSGGKVEIMVERLLDEHHVLAHVRSSKSPKTDSILKVEDAEFTVVGREHDLFKLNCHKPIMSVLLEYGHMPLPPYIDREDDESDIARYQTVYAKQDGSVAAPTAGLHFTQDILDKLKEKNIATAFVTLHVGAGTFAPVRVDKIADHHMHAEYIEVPESVCEKVRLTKANGGRVIAVGTTAARSLESASQEGEIKPFFGDTDIFIYPGINFHCIDALITNFHLPKSTLLMLVSAFVGTENIKQAYQEAIKEKYRFFSYGDAMFIG